MWKIVYRLLKRMSIANGQSLLLRSPLDLFQEVATAFRTTCLCAGVLRLAWKPRDLFYVGLVGAKLTVLTFMHMRSYALPRVGATRRLHR